MKVAFRGQGQERMKVISYATPTVTNAKEMGGWLRTFFFVKKNVREKETFTRKGEESG